MKRYLLVIFVVLLLGLFLFYKKYPHLFLRVITVENIEDTRFGSDEKVIENPFSTLISNNIDVLYGEILYDTGDKNILVSPKNGEAGFLAKLDEKDKYPEDRFDLVDFPSRKYVRFVIGNFVGWLDADSSADKYIKIKYPHPNGDRFDLFRVTETRSELFGRHITGFFVCNKDSYIPKKIDDMVNISDPEEKGCQLVNYKKFASGLIIGDTVMIETIFHPPELALKDSYGNYLVSAVFLEREQ